jgi:hypothetical protein
VQGIDANIKVVAMIETSILEDRMYNKQIVTPRIERHSFNEQIITTDSVVGSRKKRK